MPKYNLVNPVLETKITYEVKDNKPLNAARKVWKTIMEKQSVTPQFAFTLQDDKNNLHHFKVCEKSEKKGDTSFRLEKLNNVKKEEEEKLLNLLEKHEKLGGKRINKKKKKKSGKKMKKYDSDEDSDSSDHKKKKRYKNDSSDSSDSDDSDYYDVIFDTAKYYKYYPSLYVGVIPNVAVPTITYDGKQYYASIWVV